MLLVRLSGHSGAGKSRLLAALLKKKMEYKKAIIFTSRLPRTGEIDGKDYFFRSKEFINKLPSAMFLKADIHSMVQAIDLKQLENDLLSNEIVIIEIHSKRWVDLKKTINNSFKIKPKIVSVFLSAVDPSVFQNKSYKAAGDIIEKRVRNILITRGKNLSKDIRIRAKSAIDEVLEAYGWKKSYKNRKLAIGKLSDYNKIILSSPEGPDGEDDWTRKKYPVGQAAYALREFTSFIKKRRGGKKRSSIKQNLA
jgi:guanylate kinase